MKQVKNLMQGIIATSFLTIGIASISTKANAQFWNGSTVSTQTNDHAIISPFPSLIVSGSVPPSLSIYTPTHESDNRTSVLIENERWGTSNNDIMLIRNVFTAPPPAAASYKNVLRIDGEGKVIVGNVPVPNSNYQMFVEKGILTERVKVAAKGSIDWADYVFDNDYQLKSLDEVSNYIQVNKHLPDVPSAKEVSEEGIDLAKMDATLLRKIEELTLYMIELKKENNQLKQDIASLKK